MQVLVTTEPDWNNTSYLLGWDGLRGVLAENWRLALASLELYGPALLIALVIAAVYWLLYAGTRRLMLAVTRRTLQDPERRSMVQHFLDILLKLTLLMLATISVLAVTPGITNYAGPVLRVYLLFLLLLTGWSALRFFLDRQANRWNLDTSLTLLLNNVARILWVTLGIYMIFAQFGINLLPILGGLGVVGLAVGFAAQDILANFISGITMLLDRPFRIGDWIRTADREGQVTGLTLRTTRIRTRDNEYISIPNKELAGSVVTNLSQCGPLRVSLVVGVAYKTDVERARAVLLNAISNQPDILHERPIQILVHDLSASSVDLLIRFWVSPDHISTYPVITMQVRERAKAALQAAGIEIPFPHLQLHIDSAEGLRELQDRWPFPPSARTPDA
ncbi:mechanosensitive ion channel family protein [Deinococcus radiophilus]|uniref:Mechanosensitive ion channel family protein n=1 Tax=Deinococcus radiophilus TaxID=32062 RepID=A0A3S0KNI1_9DEIO|nr:mechanosensitive ion channel family protein [Deinococcus radiophilus]